MGDLIIDITAVGNLAFSHQEELTFEVSATVGEVLVEVGDPVEEGQVLAELDASEWEEQLDTLERNLTTAERNVTSAERKLATKESSLLQAEINLKSAQLAYDKAESNQRTTEEELEIKELQVELAEMHLEEAQNAVVDAEQDIVDAQQAIVNAEQAVEYAQQELDEANTASLVISAPFAGLVTTVSVSIGDVVQENRVAVILTDPTELEADILVNEIDFFNIRLGAEAIIQVDAMTGISLPAKVTGIAPTAIIQAGVVNYKVKVEIESLQAMMQEQQYSSRI